MARFEGRARERETEAAGMLRDMHSADRQRGWCIGFGLDNGVNQPGKVLAPEVRTVPRFWCDSEGGSREIRP
jgi:hypothetical protein